jgi:hypothetical protein
MTVFDGFWMPLGDSNGSGWCLFSGAPSQGHVLIMPRRVYAHAPFKDAGATMWLGQSSSCGFQEW